MKPQPWSFSSLDSFTSCPKKFYHLRVVKDYKDTTNEMQLHGVRVHEALEKFINGENPSLLDPFQVYREYAEQLRDSVGVTYTERQMAISKSMEPCDWKDQRVWCRGIVDFMAVDGDVATVVDHKLGKNRKPNSTQLALFALLTFIYHPEVNTVHTKFAWLHYIESGNYLDAKTYTRDEIPKLWKLFVQDLTMYRDAFRLGIFVPRPSGLCKRHCPVKVCSYCGV